jgi:EthD domain
VDVAIYLELGDLEMAATVVDTCRRDMPTDGSFSVRSFAARELEVRAAASAGVHGFSTGTAPEGYDRRRWQQRWRAHAALLDTTPTFSRYLKGYTQYHGLDAVTVARLGADGVDGVAHMAYGSLEDRAVALQLPEYLDVLRSDEDQFVDRNHGVSILVSQR